MFSLKSEDGYGLVEMTLVLGLAVVVVAVIVMIVLATIDASSLQQLKEGIEVVRAFTG